MENNHDNNSSSSSFWKNSSRTVPGRPSPKKQTFRSVRGVQGGTSSFQDFQESVSDAWDLGDDEFCIISGISGTCLAKIIKFFFSF